MRRLLILSLALLLLVACTSKPVEPPGSGEPTGTPAPGSSKEAPAPGAPTVPTPSAPAATAPEIPAPTALPEGVRRVDLAAGQSISDPGLYYMDVATGKLEGWPLPPFDQKRPMGWMQTTPDHRWLMFRLDDKGYLLRRRDAKVYSYKANQIWVTPGPGLFLLRSTAWQPGAGGQFTLVNEEMQVVSTFVLEPGMPSNVQFLFSPDGKKLAAAEVVGDSGRLSLVDVATGAVTTLADSQGQGSISLTALPALGEFVVAHGDYQKPLWLERYTWQGNLVGRKQVDGWHAEFTADGRMVAYAQLMGPYGQAAVVQGWDEEKPLLRVAGALGPVWLADGMDLQVSTSQGWQLVSRTGEMRPVPQGGEPRWHPFQWYIPSPDTADLFLTGTNVIDRLGLIVQATQIADVTKAHAQSAGWGPASREVHIAVVPPLGKGFEREVWSAFAPRVQHYPFPQQYPLQVQDARGDCLNLRAEPALKGRVVRCLPAGTRLAMLLKPDQSPPAAWEDQLQWLQVETEAGEKGWVAISTGSITYADR